MGGKNSSLNIRVTDLYDIESDLKTGAGGSLSHQFNVTWQSNTHTIVRVLLHVLKKENRKKK